MSETPPPGWQFAYGTAGKVRHLLPESASLNSYRPSRCGIGPRWFDLGWCGSGSQDEIELMATLSTCRRCVGLIEKDRADTEAAEQFWLKLKERKATE